MRRLWPAAGYVRPEDFQADLAAFQAAAFYKYLLSNWK